MPVKPNQDSQKQKQQSQSNSNASTPIGVGNLNSSPINQRYNNNHSSFSERRQTVPYSDVMLIPNSNSSSLKLNWILGNSVTGDAPLPRGFHSCTLIPNSECLVFIGGDAKDVYFSDVRFFDLRTLSWRPETPDINLFAGRSGHSCIYYNGKLYLFGGKYRQNYLSDLLIFDLNSKKWVKAKQHSSVKPRGGHTACEIGGKMYIFGGLRTSFETGSTEYVSELLVYDLNRDTWDLQPQSSTPDFALERAGHSAVASGHYMYVFGGRRNTSVLNDTIVFDTISKRWTTINSPVQPSNRAGHAACIVADRFMLVYSGGNWHQFFNELNIFNLEHNNWSSIRFNLSDPQVPAPRFWHTCALYDHKMFIFGGGCRDSSGRDVVFNQMHILDLEPLYQLIQQQQQQQAFTSPSTSPRNIVHPPYPLSPAPSSTPTTVNNRNSQQLIYSPTQPNSSLQNSVNSSSKNRLASPSAMPGLVSPIPQPNISSPMIAANPSSTSEIALKFVYGEETRTFLFSSLDYASVMTKLEQQYQKPLVLKYHDADSDLVTIRSNEELNTAIKFFKQVGRSMKFTITDSTTPNFIPFQPVASSHTSSPTPPTPRPNGAPKFLYQLGKVLGSGAYGKVYLGVNAENGELMAVKEIDVSKGEKERNIKEVMNEINLMKNFSHENIVKYLGVDREGDKLHIFMEYVPGGSIQDLLQEEFGCFHESLVRTYTKQILLGLKYLHDNNVIHRDLKGANILVTDKGICKLADFGHSKNLSQGTSKSVNIRGTPIWMAPEAIGKGSQPGRHGKYSDVWSLGCVVIEMLTGEHPYADVQAKNPILFENPFSVMMYISNLKAPPKFPPTLSKQGKQFLSRCLQLDETKRATVDQLLEESFITEPYNVGEEEEEGEYGGVEEEEEETSDVDTATTTEQQYRNEEEYTGTTEDYSEEIATEDAATTDIHGQESEEEEEEEEEYEEEEEEEEANSEEEELVNMDKTVYDLQRTLGNIEQYKINQVQPPQQVSQTQPTSFSSRHPSNLHVNTNMHEGPYVEKNTLTSPKERILHIPTSPNPNPYAIPSSSPVIASSTVSAKRDVPWNVNPQLLQHRQSQIEKMKSNNALQRVSYVGDRRDTPSQYASSSTSFTGPSQLDHYQFPPRPTSNPLQRSFNYNQPGPSSSQQASKRTQVNNQQDILQYLKYRRESITQPLPDKGNNK